MGTRQSDPAVGLNAAVAAELEGERAAAGLTLRELADASGVSYRTLQRLLKSRDRHIDLNVLEQLAQVFRTTPERILVAAQERMLRTDPDAYEAIRRNERLGNQLSRKRTTGTDRPARGVRRPS